MGGKAARQTISQAVDLVGVGGKIIVLGITDDLVPINLNKVVNFGLHILGSSRSQISNYQKVLKLISDKKIQKLFFKMVQKKIQSEE